MGYDLLGAKDASAALVERITGRSYSVEEGPEYPAAPLYFMTGRWPQKVLDCFEIPQRAKVCAGDSTTRRVPYYRGRSALRQCLIRSTTMLACRRATGLEDGHPITG